MSFTISDLRERPEFFDVVAERIWQAWWQPRDFPLTYIRTRLTENLNAAPLPVALVAHRGNEFLGTASVIASDLDERPQYTPWVAAVWTEPDARGQGVGHALVASAIDTALATGCPKVYLCATSLRRSFYLELGWTVLEEGIGPRQVMIFVRDRVT